MSKLWIYAGCGFIAMFCLACLGFFALPEILIQLAVGWIFFLARVVPEITVNWPGALTGVVCLAGLAFGLHAFSEWLYREIRKSRGAAEVAPWPVRWTASVLGVVVLMFVAGISTVGISHQTVWLLRAPELLFSGGYVPGARVSTTNNLKQLGLALHTFHDDHQSFPAGCVIDEHGKLLHGWHTAILPYIEQGDLLKTIDMKIPWDDPHNSEPFRRVIRVYLARDRERERAQTNNQGQALTHFAGNACLLGGDLAHTLAEITDGTGHIILAGEVNSEFKPWGYPANWRDPALGINRSPKGFGAPWGSGAALFLFADGSVRSLSDSMTSSALKALSTPSSGDEGQIISDVP